VFRVTFKMVASSTIVGTSQSNGTGAGSMLTDLGQISLWIGFAFTVTATVVFGFLSYIRNVRPEARLTYYLVTIINAITALAYLTMAFGSTTMKGHNGERQFEWIRYAAWALVAPVTVWILGLLSGTHWVDLVWITFVSIIGIAAGFAGAISEGWNATWPLFTFGAAMYIPVFIALAFTFRRAAYKVHTEIGKLYDVVGFGSLVLYAGYVITWGVSEGGFITTVDQEIIIYTVLDIATKVLFGFVLIYSREAIARYGTFLRGRGSGAFPARVPESSYILCSHIDRGPRFFCGGRGARRHVPGGRFYSPFARGAGAVGR